MKVLFSRRGIRSLFLVLFLLQFVFVSSASAASRWSSDNVVANTPHNGRVPVARQGIVPLASSPQGLTPAQIRTAYGLPSSGGSGTIALILAYDNPNAEADLATFSTQFSLPSCTTLNGCFEKHKMTTSIPTNSGWNLESSLDVQWSHAIAPSAKILLVEARSSSIANLMAAVNYARNRSDVVAISMSWGSAEFSTQSTYNASFISPYNAAFFAATGDSGTGVIWPSTSANVVAVGGTTLAFSGGSVSAETAWSGSGGGISAYESLPDYQTTFGVSGSGGMRAVPDVSYDADPASGFSVYDSFGYSGSSGWFVVGGTSAGSPQWAAIHALGQSATHAALYAVAANPSAYSSQMRDVTSGTNGSCGTLCTAVTGYDFVTGLGSPLTANFSVPTSVAEVTEATGGVDVSIDTTSHAGGTGSWTTLTGPVVTETASGQIATGVHTITLPAGWEFNTAHAVTIVVSGSTLALASGTVTPGSTSVSFTVTAVSSGGGSGSLTFSGMQIRPTGTTAPTVGYLTHTGSAIAGIDSVASWGPLSTAAGTATAVRAETTIGGHGDVVPTQSMVSGTTTAAYAVTRDQFGNFVGSAPATWSLLNKTGGVSDNDLVADTNTDTAAFSAHLIGSAQIHAAIDGLASTDSGIITVTAGTTSSIDIAPRAASITADDTQAYTIEGFDTAGNSTGATTTPTLSISDLAGGSFTGYVYTPEHSGMWTVTATLGDISTSTLLTVATGTPATMAFSMQPASTTAGTSISAIHVALSDQHGNLANAATNPVSLSFGTNAGSGTLSGSVSTTSVSGVATFSDLSIDKTGVGYTVVASSSGLTSATSTAFNIANAAADHLIFSTQPSDAQTGATLSAVVAAKDIFGNAAADYIGTVTLAAHGNPTALKGTVTTSAASGIATFNNFHIDDTGTYSLDASADGLTATTSASLVISAPAPQNNSGGGGGGGGGGAVINPPTIIVPTIATSTTATSTTTASATSQTTTQSAARSTQISSLVAQLVSLIQILKSLGGHVDPSLEAAVNSLASAQSASSATTPAFTRDLQLGMNGADVRALQQYLIDQNSGAAAQALAQNGVSGHFGALTQAALIEFQQARGITPATGYFGPKTRAVMHG